MYLFAILFLLGAVYNIEIENYAEAIGGIAISAILFESKYFWDSDEALSTSKKLRLPVGIAIFIIAISVASFYTINNIEVNTDKYTKIANIKQSYPSLKPLIDESMSDGKISVIEYFDIFEQYSPLGKKAALEIINDK